MNNKLFEVFKRYRKRKYDRDLERLQNDFAERGMTFSGARQKAEETLKADFDDELETKQEEARIFEEERRNSEKERKNQIWTNRVMAGVTIITLVIITPLTMYLGLTQPERERKVEEGQKIKNEIVSLYRTIVANEDIFISNINELREFASSTSFNILPNNYIQGNLNLEIQDELQKRIGLINYRFLLHYIDQTNLLNNTIGELKANLPTGGFRSERFEQNKNFYLELMSYLKREGWEDTKFNYQIDTGCLLKILQEAFPYISDERNSEIECGNASLNRIYSYFGYYEVDTPEWMKSKFREALKENGVDAWWIK